MRRDLTRRLEQLEREMLMPPSCQVIRIRGGLPTCDSHAAAGPLRFWREPAESQWEFEERVILAAEAAGESLVIFDGLPDLR